MLPRDRCASPHPPPSLSVSFFSIPLVLKTTIKQLVANPIRPRPTKSVGVATRFLPLGPGIRSESFNDYRRRSPLRGELAVLGTSVVLNGHWGQSSSARGRYLGQPFFRSTAWPTVWPRSLSSTEPGSGELRLDSSGSCCSPPPVRSPRRRWAMAPDPESQTPPVPIS